MTAYLAPTPPQVEALLARARGGGARTVGAMIEEAATASTASVRLAPEAATRLITREALIALGDPHLRCPEEPAARAALAHAIDHALGRLRRAGTTPEALRSAGTDYAAALASLLEDTSARLARAKLCDAREARWIAASRLARAEVVVREIASPRAAISGLYAFEPDELAWIEALHAASRRVGGEGVAIELPRLPMHLARLPEDPIEASASAIEQRFASLTDPPEIAWVSCGAARPVEIVAARNVDGEARAAVRAVIDALVRGASPERVAIVVPDLDEELLAPLRAALADAEIPFAEPRGKPASSSPEGRIALGLLAVAAGPVTREIVMELLRAPGVDPGIWIDRGGDVAQRAALVAHRLREIPVEIDRTGWLLYEALGASLDQGDLWMQRALGKLLASARWIGGDEEGAAPALTRREIGARLLDLMDRLRLGVPSTGELAALLRAGSSPGVRAIGEGAAAVRAIRAAVRSIVDGAAIAGLGGAHVTLADFAAELGLTAGELGAGLGVARTSAVQIGRPEELGGVDRDLVVVMGLSEGAYGGAEVDLAIVDERLRRRLPKTARPPSAREREIFRRAELVATIAHAGAIALTLTSGDDREPAAPHPLVRWAESFGLAPRTEPASRVSVRASRLDARGAELCALALGAPPRGDVAERAIVERGRTAFFLDPRAPADAWSGLVFTGDERVRRRLVEGVGGDGPERTVAVTAIERAAACAFAGFARRVLRVRRTDDLGEFADARERGTLVHRALEAAFLAMREAPLSEQLRAARAGAERALRSSSSMAPLRKEAVRQAIAEAMSLAARAIDAGDPLRFRFVEQRFGAEMKPPWAPLALRGEGPVVWVDGQIDRVDVDDAGRRARVVDYKTGRIPTGEEQRRSSFQLPLYAAVVAEALGFEEVEAVFVSLRPRGLIEEWPRAAEDRRDLGARRGEIAQAARRVIATMWRGEVPPRPIKAALCARCEARDVCRRPAIAPVEEEAAP